MQNSVISKGETFDASNIKVGVAVARFNSDITDAMVENLMKGSQDYKIDPKNITVLRVPGAVELPLLLQNMALSEKFDCLVCLGCVIRGDTTHYDYVCKYVTEGVMQVSLGLNVPIGFGVLTVENHDQALARIATGFGSLEASIQSLKHIVDLTETDQKMVVIEE
jgi:6,7-dimethyl-8-ribityllumazine synthase